MSRISDSGKALAWRKSTFSMAGNGDCVQVASADGEVFLRDTKDEAGATLAFPAAAWREFLTKAGRQLYSFVR